METKSHKKMYKAGKQWVAVAVATTAAGVAFVSNNESASADVWQANSVDQVASQVSNNGGVNNYQIQSGDTVWALAMATNDTVDNFAAVNGIANPDLIVSGQHFNGTNAAAVPAAQVAPAQSQQAPAQPQQAQPTQTAYSAAPSADEIAASEAAASQAAANEAVAASQAAASEAAASSAAASEAYAASVAESQAQAASMAAAESDATAASEAAAKAAQSEAIAATAKANAAAQSAQSASAANNTASANAQAAASQQQQTQSSQATAATAGNTDNSTFDALKSKRSGMTTEWSSDLAAQAQARAQQIANAGGSIPNEHWSNPNEVISIGFGSGSPVVDAWYNETNMATASGTGHRDWEMRAGSTHFGFAQVGDVIVGVSR